MSLKGSYYVYPTATAISRAWKLCDGMKNYQLLRRHGLKLAYWPNKENSDMDWDWVRSLANKGVGELRIDEKINGHRNLRVIFYKSDTALKGDPVDANGETMKRIWLLTVFPKKRDDFTANEIKVFAAARKLIIEKHYVRKDPA